MLALKAHLQSLQGAWLQLGFPELETFCCFSLGPIGLYDACFYAGGGVLILSIAAFPTAALVSGTALPQRSVHKIVFCCNLVPSYLGVSPWRDLLLSTHG